MKQLSALKFTIRDRNITVNSEAVLIEDAHIWKIWKISEKLEWCALHYHFTIGSNRCSPVIRVILQPLISLAFM